MALKDKKSAPGTAAKNAPAKASAKTAAKERPFEVNPEISFSVTEAYKSLRTNINFAIPGHGCKSFLITSAVLAEGKTTTSTSVALTIAQTDARVVIIDCDMRRPKVHSKFKMVNKLGLSNILSGMCTLDEALQKVGTLSLDIITAGTIPPNPAELLESPVMESLLAELKEKYDYIILDTPPIDIVSDALPLTKLVDGVVLVVRYRQSVHPELANALNRLEFVGAHILGLVLNGVEETTTYYRGRYKRYGKKYRSYEYGYSAHHGSKRGYGYGYGYAGAAAQQQAAAAQQAQTAADTTTEAPQGK